MNLLTDIIQGLIKGLTSSNSKLKLTVKLAIFLTMIAIVVTVVSKIDKSNEQLFEIIAGAVGAIAALIGLGVKVYEDTKDREKREEKIENLEKEVKEKPTETKTAWELARLKLESYLNRNLQQVSSIFYLSVTVMIVGFGLIIFGVYQVFTDPELMNPSILATCSGIVVNFIGGTFLLIYRSTMKQAKNYVDVLERINAVGMSIQILENISSEKGDLKDETTAQISKELLKIYSEMKINKKESA
ncbi:hypothetical protein Oweho_0255 [Owenweeksia hongkongensis DSM 17368]|uniref:Cyanobacterial TRADD-N associated 2 transmembrane domain-containing protein n=1 Tax=Owenweeksia hongkongensis (strain DSM 17368 / CIP 108786 / JCM 12287 / NRRL B-23963 / UST20020801) TaxID=926562 RepID=G8R7G6_OWEHD|nr:hypothetical protein [Owenweeksia hongkongensis]AEV31277.1 hypothetical protein Oweho_0255 [Owenweeksia hongkongensis DSM 17368]